MMAPPDLERHALIEHAVLQLGKRGASSLALWTAMATALGEIIGVAGFDSLFFRSLHQAEKRYPWLVAPVQASTGSVDQLSALLATRPFDDAESASIALLIIFTDTLNLLIGELITNRILLAAWGTLAVNDAPEQDNEQS